MFLKQNRGEYYDRLDAIRTRGDWEGWLRFFLIGAAVTAANALKAATDVTELRDQHMRLAGSENLGRYGAPMVDLLFEHPLVTVRFAIERIGGTPPTIGKLLGRLTALGVVEEVTGRKWDRAFRYSPFLDLLASSDPTEASP